MTSGISYGGRNGFEALVLHELGHAGGLGGSADPSSVMSETLPAGVICRTPTRADLNVGDADSRPDAERAAPVPAPLPVPMASGPALPDLAADGPRIVSAGSSGRLTNHEAVDLLGATGPGVGGRRETELGVPAARTSWMGVSATGVPDGEKLPTLATQITPPASVGAGTGGPDTDGVLDAGAALPSRSPADLPGAPVQPGGEPTAAHRDAFFQAAPAPAGRASAGEVGAGSLSRGRTLLYGAEGEEASRPAATSLAGSAAVFFVLLGTAVDAPARRPGGRKPWWHMHRLPR
jgi:hypothetical protein